MLAKGYQKQGLQCKIHPHGYHSIHYVIKFSFGKESESYLAEVQVRTLIEEAWSEIDHTIKYPREIASVLVKDYLMMFSRLAASADEMGSFITDYRQELQNTENQLRERHGGFDTEDISALATILGMSITTVNDAVKESTAREAPTGVEEYRERRKGATSGIVKGRLAVEVLREYYAPVESGLSRYQVAVDGTERDTSIYSSPSRIGMSLLTKDLDVQLINRSVSVHHHPHGALALRVLRFLVADKARMWNAPMYRLCAASFEDVFQMRFSISDYFTYRFRAGLLEDEVVEALMEASNNPTAAAKQLRARDSFLPRNALTDFDARICQGGMGALCAFARDKEQDFYILLHVRSRNVADGRGLLSIVPKAAHQPGVNDPIEARIYWTVLREIYEELFSGALAEHNPARAKVDWYCDDCPAVRALHDEEFGSTIKTTGFCVDALTGNYFVSNVVIVPDAKYWIRFGASIQSMWEQEKQFISVSSRDLERITDLVKNGLWADDGLFAFVEGLLKLKLDYPDRVDIGRLGRRLLG